MTSPRNLLKAWELKPKKRLGQNFLTDPSTARTIIARADLSADDVVLEIGAGLGALTIPLAMAVKKVYAVEKDDQLIELLKAELLANRITNCEVIAQNILEMKLDTIAAATPQKLTVVGNLPYGISSQILIKLIQSRSAIERAVLMFQKELAQRIGSEPGGRQYGRITAMLRYCADIRFLADIKASVFYPPPKVDSTVIEITFKATTIYGPHDEDMLYKVIKAAFGNRRKTLKNALTAAGLQIESQIALQALSGAGIDPTRRAETLSPSEFVALSVSLQKTMKGKGS
ncbi:MAG: ribosomal RNA small subunit methyltransferase A [Deltaproteobacteria bacterium]|jgi:16S rRNA (adenine1518-N6/adenine1519-N6)-dimethyltransferase|nr:ribosomal RNA small subunit methyltransferase A [Deltaproteobacteria bacterium]MBW2480101.1 ribosomal RNA small subunit methyltransferase A [Deltaproteobacteria bacterium]